MGSAEGGPSWGEGVTRLHVPGTRLIRSGVEQEGLLEVVEADHLLVECVHLYAAAVAGEAEGLRGLWAQHRVRVSPPTPPRQDGAQGAAGQTEARRPADGVSVQGTAVCPGWARLTVKLLG